MKWLCDNWTLLVVILATIVFVYRIGKRYMGLPSEEQLKKVKAWLLYAVIEAEKTYSSGTGRLKLAAVYSQFIELFPSLVPILPYELFSKMVDEVLVEMRKLLETNLDIACYVRGDMYADTDTNNDIHTSDSTVDTDRSEEARVSGSESDNSAGNN